MNHSLEGSNFMDRRDFLKLSLSGMAAVAVGSVKIPGIFQNQAHAATNIINLSMTEAMVEMFDKVQVYHWVYSCDVSNPAAGVKGLQGVGPSFPGPVIFATAGDQLTLNITNNLPGNVPHAFQIVGTKIKTGPIPPGQTKSITFKVPDGGTYMYIDPLNAPINRVMGLHGCLISLPPFTPRQRITPYSKPTATVQAIFNDLGVTPELPPNQADVAAFGRGGWFADLDLPNPRFRLWFVNSTDPVLNGEIQAGVIPTPDAFRRRYVALYMMMNGRSGGYCTSHKEIKPAAMIGQPILIRFLNAGMVQHSAHIHGNHILVMSVNNQIQDNVFSLDTFAMRPLDRVDWLLPYRMPPDIPNVKNDAANNGAASFHVPPTGILRTNCAQELQNRPGLDTRWPLQRPMPYPMHCHSEPSQAGAGGNYPGGLVTHWEINGDIDGVLFDTTFGPDLLSPFYTSTPRA